MAECSCEKFLRETFEVSHILTIHICYCVQRNAGFQSILSYYLPLRLGVKPGNHVIMSFIVLAVLQQSYQMLWSSARFEEDKTVLPSSYAMGCILVEFPQTTYLLLDDLMDLEVH